MTSDQDDGIDGIFADTVDPDGLQALTPSRVAAEDEEEEHDANSNSQPSSPADAGVDEYDKSVSTSKTPSESSVDRLLRTGGSIFDPPPQPRLLPVIEPRLTLKEGIRKYLELPDDPGFPPKTPPPPTTEQLAEGDGDGGSNADVDEGPSSATAQPPPLAQVDDDTITVQSSPVQIERDVVETDAQAPTGETTSAAAGEITHNLAAAESNSVAYSFQANVNPLHL